MKKKEFNEKLTLGKKVISNLQTNAIHGGTDTIVRATTYVIITTIKITTEIYTKPEVCPEDSNDCGSTRCTTIPPTCTTCLAC